MVLYIKVDFERGYLRIWSPPEKYLGSQWILQNFTNSLFPKYEGPRYENKSSQDW